MSGPNPPDAVPGDRPPPSNQPHDDEAVSTELDDTGDGEPGRIAQEPVGSEMTQGGGEVPSPDTPPSGSAPGTAGMTSEHDAPDQAESFKDVLDTDPEKFGSSTTPDD